MVVMSPSPPGVSAAVPGGRVDLYSYGPIRYYDSRESAGRRSALPPDVQINGLVRLIITEATADGEAFVFPCSGSPGSDPNFSYAEKRTVIYTVSAVTSCLYLTSPAQVILEQMGTIAPTPSADLLQYQPLASPEKVYEASPYRLIDQTAVVPLPGVPSNARAAVVLLEVSNPTATGYASVGRRAAASPPFPARCNSAVSATVIFQPGERTAGLDYVALEPGVSEICLQVRNGDQTTRVTLLGFLVTDGVDNTRLPPVLVAAERETAPPGLEPVSPQRLLDSREPAGPTKGAKVEAGSTLELAIPQATGYTASAVLNVTVVDPERDGYLTVYPCDAPRPVVSNLNYVPGDIVPNLVNVKLSVTRTVCFFAQYSTHLVVDLSGTFERAGGTGVAPVVPTRILDTREPIGVLTKAKVQAGQSIKLQVAGAAPGIPGTGLSAATMNVTVDRAEGSGFVTAYPCDQDRPEASNLNFVPGPPVPNLVTVQLAPDGSVCLFASATTDLIADLTAWYGDGQTAGFKPVVPERFLDTRSGLGAPGAGKVEANTTLRLQITGRGDVPASGATGVAVNVTVVDPVGPGYVTVFPCDAPKRPETSNLNFEKNDIVPNLVFTKIALTGTLCLFTTARTDLLVDVAGYFTEATENVRTPGFAG
jgi:hypothetical protein